MSFTIQSASMTDTLGGLGNLISSSLSFISVLKCSFSHCGAARVHWWARGMGRHMVDKTWPGVRSSAVGGGGERGADDTPDCLVTLWLLLPFSQMGGHC